MCCVEVNHCCMRVRVKQRLCPDRSSSPHNSRQKCPTRHAHKSRSQLISSMRAQSLLQLLNFMAFPLITVPQQQNAAYLSLGSVTQALIKTSVTYRTLKKGKWSLLFPLVSGERERIEQAVSGAKPGHLNRDSFWFESKVTMIKAERAAVTLTWDQLYWPTAAE